MAQDWSRGEGLLEGAEGFVRLAGPGELDPLAGEGSEGGGEGGVLEDEFAVEAGEAEEGLDPLHRLGGRPLQMLGPLSIGTSASLVSTPTPHLCDSSECY